MGWTPVNASGGRAGERSRRGRRFRGRLSYRVAGGACARLGRAGVEFIGRIEQATSRDGLPPIYPYSVAIRGDHALVRAGW